MIFTIILSQKKLSKIKVKLLPKRIIFRWMFWIFRSFDKPEIHGDYLNKKYYVVRNAGYARSRYTLKLSQNFFLKSIN